VFRKRDQFAAEILYFSDCILQKKEPEPSGKEGLIDVQIISAAYQSVEAGRAIRIQSEKRLRRVDASQQIDRPPVEEPELLNARMPSGATRKK